MRLVAIPAALELADDLVDLAELRVPEYALADHDHNDVEKARAEVVAVENALTAIEDIARRTKLRHGPASKHYGGWTCGCEICKDLAAALAVVRSLTKGT